MKGTETVDVIHIPETGLPVGIVTLPLLRMTDLKTMTPCSRQHEIHLTHIPNLFNKKYTDWLDYAQEHRELVNLGNMDPKQPLDERCLQHGPYYMYKISNSARKMMTDRRNEHFVKAGCEEDVYGNAFIFKVKKPVFEGGSCVVQLENLDEIFITSAFKGKGITAEESLKWLSTQ